MPTETDLTGLGMSPFLATELGNQPSSLNCVGTVQAGAALILSKNVELTASAGNTAAILPAGAKVGSPFFVSSIGATGALLFVPLGHSLTGSLNGSYQFSTQNTMALFLQSSLKKWRVIPNTPA
jgi:hypothetical protein